MKKILIFTLVALALCLEAQAQVNNIVLNAGVAYTNGAPTFRPGGKGSRIAIDTVTWIWYESLDNNTGNWIESGYRVQPISGCSHPAYTPNKHQSVLVINGCDSLYYYRAGAWRHINPPGVSGVAWGDITGDIANQTDLQTALSDKADAAHNHALSDVLQSGATSGQVPKWNGSAWVPATVSGGGVSYKSQLGKIVDQKSFPSTTGFSINGVTVSATGGMLSFSGGANDYVQTLDYAYNSALDNYNLSADFIADEKSATSYGFGVGRRSNNTTTAQRHSIDAKFLATSSGGTLYIFSIRQGGIDTLSVSTSNLLFSAGDSIRVSLFCVQNKVSANAYNLTTKSSLVSCEYFYQFELGAVPMPNTGRYCIYSHGGNFRVKSFSVYSGEPKNRTLFVGDSKTQGYYSTAGGRIVDICQNKIGYIGNVSGSGDKTSEVISRTAEIQALNPVQVVLCIGANDFFQNVPNTTITSNYDTICARLASMGIKVFHLPLYQSTSPITALYNHIVTTFPDSTILKTYEISGGTTFLNADGIHPNLSGVSKIASIITGSGILYTLPGSQPESSISGNINPGGLVAFSSSGGRLATSSFFKWDNVNSRLGINNSTPAYDVDCARTNGTANFDFFRARGGNNILLGNFGSMFQGGGVAVQTLWGLRLGGNIHIGAGGTNQNDLHIENFASGGNIRVIDRGANALVTWNMGSSISSTTINGGFSYAGISNNPAGTFAINAPLGSGTGKTGDIIFSVGSQVAPGTSSHTLSQKLWIKGGSGFLGVNTSNPGFTLDLNSTDAIRIPLGTTAQRPTTAESILRGNSTTHGPEYYDGSRWVRYSTTATPTATPHSNLGTGGTSVVMRGNDMEMVLNLTSGAAPTIPGQMCSITFGYAFDFTPNVIISAANEAAAKLHYFVPESSVTTTGLQIWCSSIDTVDLTTSFKFAISVKQ